MMRHFLVAGLMLAGLAAVPAVAADHMTCSNDPDIPQAVKTACFVAAGGVHFAFVTADLVTGYAFCFLLTPPINWASCL